MAASAVSPRLEMEAALIKKCWQDPEFKKQIIADPKGMFERATGQKLPPNLKIMIHEEDRNTLHLAIPPAPANVQELSDEDLERVAGGTELVLGTALIFTAAAALSATAGGWFSTQKAGW
jgi:hypothetical protein